VDKTRLRWWALAVTVLAVLVDMIDTQIVTVAAPTIQRDLQISDAALQWITAGYALGFALMLITGGRLGDHYGRKRLFVLGMTGFTMSSLAAGLAPNGGILIAARIAQGVSSGLMVPQVLSFIQSEFDEPERPKAMTYYSAAFPLGGMAGPLLGGLIIQADLFGIGWRAVFLVNLPVGVIAIIGALATMPARPRQGVARIDRGGLVLLTLALFALFYPLVQGRELGWPLWSIGLMAGFIPLIVLFAWQQRAAAQRGAEPLIPPGLLRIRSLVASLAVIFPVNTAVGVFFILTLHLQLGLAYSALKTALTFVPAAFGIVFGNVVAIGFGKGRRGFATIAVGVLILGLGAVAVLVRLRGTDLGPWELIAPGLAFGIGIGSLLNTLFTTALTQVRPDQAGAASGLVNTTVQLGTATGIALFGTIFFSRLPRGYVVATTTSMTVCIGLLVVAMLLTAALPKSRPPTTADVPQAGVKAPA
jgi:EmrB/QacA subfamily drug resistance transporter